MIDLTSKTANLDSALGLRYLVFIPHIPEKEVAGITKVPLNLAENTASGFATKVQEGRQFDLTLEGQVVRRILYYTGSRTTDPHASDKVLRLPYGTLVVENELIRHQTLTFQAAGHPSIDTDIWGAFICNRAELQVAFRTLLSKIGVDNSSIRSCLLATASP